MDFIACGKIAYAVRGGIQIDSCQMYSDADFSFNDIPPSILAQARDANGIKPLYQTTIFGKTIDKSNTVLASDDTGRVDPNYKIGKSYIIEAQEVALDGMQAIVEVAGKVAGYIQQLSILHKQLSMPDISTAGFSMLKNKITTKWSDLIALSTYSGSLTTGGDSITITASGIPIGNTTYTYSTRYGFGTLKTILVLL